MKATLDTPINSNVVSDVENPAIITALDVIERTKFSKVEKDTSNLRIQRFIEDGFKAQLPAGTRKINGKMIAQAIFNVVNRMKPLDFQIHGAGRPEYIEQIVSLGVGTCMAAGGYLKSLRDKNGAFMKMLTYGDGYIMVGANPDPEAPSPILFTPISNTNVYFDPFATTIRGAWGQRATKALVVFNYSWPEACRLWPKLKKKGGKGRIPREQSIYKDLEMKYEQKPDIQKDEVEVAFFYDITNLNYTIFAGTACTILEEYEGEADYPFFYTTAEGKEEAFIPILDFLCFPASEGMYNYGIGNAIYDLAVISQRLTNMGTNHALDVADPIWHFTMPKGEAGKFFNKMSLAQEMRANGKKGFITTEYDPMAPGSNQVGVNSLMAQSDYNMWTAMYERLDRELKRFGINLDQIERGTNTSATQVMAEEEAANALVKQIMEWNASESQVAVEITMAMIKKYIRKNDKTPLNLTTSIEAEGVEFRPDQVTLGMVAEELRKHHYFVKINARSGALPSNTMLQERLNQVLNRAMPGSPAWVKANTQLAKLYDVELKAEDFGQQQQQAAPQELNPAEVATQSQTGRQTINPRVKTQMPV